MCLLYTMNKRIVVVRSMATILPSTIPVMSELNSVSWSHYIARVCSLVELFHCNVKCSNDGHMIKTRYPMMVKRYWMMVRWGGQMTVNSTQQTDRRWSYMRSPSTSYTSSFNLPSLPLKISIGTGPRGTHPTLAEGGTGAPNASSSTGKAIQSSILVL